MAHLDPARLRELLTYDPETGIFTRLARVRGLKPGSVAGNTNDRGYSRITIDGKSYRSHRLAWLWMTGEWPKNQIDHINRNRSDNRWVNLRSATQSENSANLVPGRPSASGHKGVYWAPHAKCWRAELNLVINGKRRKRVLGYFQNPDEAAAVRAAEARKIWGDRYLEQAANDNTKTL